MKSSLTVMRTWRRGLGGAITRIQEKREAGKNPTDFVAKLLQETLGLEKEPLLDRSHRTLRERPQEDQPPRAFVVRFQYYREKEAILRKAATAKDLTTRKYNSNNPVVNSSLRIWSQFRRHFGYRQTISSIPIVRNPAFKPAPIDSAFHLCVLLICSTKGYSHPLKM
ncbi:hypothetical protein F7725_007665 [Dissostichus mawsoni]|uniref:Uncharacterized protein n=1 Tax=Dissostichus mawsoni TaxID=36200 RepID=A0A7J5Y518_DISMA|nr:hypothetical protein F7725_007665 [Dissostichus mawsoni]